MVGGGCQTRDDLSKIRRRGGKMRGRRRRRRRRREGGREGKNRW